MLVLVILMVSHKCHRLSSFILLFFIFLLANFKSILLEFTDSLFCLIKSAVDAVHCIINFFHYIRSVQNFYLLSDDVHLLYLSYGSCIVFLISLKCLNLFCSSSLWFLKTIFNSVPGSLQISVWRGVDQLLDIYYVSLVESCFLSFLYIILYF